MLVWGGESGILSGSPSDRNLFCDIERQIEVPRDFGNSEGLNIRNKCKSH